MGINAGNKVLIKASKTPITTYAEATSGTVVKNLGSFDNSTERETIDVTSFGDKYEKSIPGIKKGTLSLSGVINKEDLGQKIIFDEYNSDTGEGVYLAIWENLNDKVCTVYHVFVNKLGKKAEVNGKQELTLDFSLMEEPKELSQV